jgi:hypothetical protein
MRNVKDLTIDEFEGLIEQKILEVPGEPDSGLEVKEESRRKLKSRLGNPSRKLPHNEVMKVIRGQSAKS